MSNDEMRFDESQFQRLLELATPKTSHRLTIDRIFTLFQVLAIVCGGTWTLLSYMEFEKNQKAMALEAQGLQLRQQKLTIDLEVERSKVTLSTQKYENDLKALELAQAHTHRIRTETKVTATKKKQLNKTFALYTVAIAFTITNTSREKLEVTSTVVEPYLGTRKKFPLDQSSMHRINPPGELYEHAEFDDVAEEAIIRWQPLKYTAGKYRAGLPFDQIKVGNSFTGLQRHLNFDFREGGGATGVLEENESGYLTYDYSVIAKEEQLVGFIVSVTLNRYKTLNDFYQFENWMDLNETETNQKSGAIK